MGRWLFLMSSVVLTANCADCHAQWYGWGGYNSGVGTAYSANARSAAALTMARGAAAEDYAKANQANELARSQYLDNQAKYIQMRRDLRASNEARDQKRKEEAKARAALRPPPKTAAQIYPRLSVDELDPLTGEIHWPDSLSGGDYEADRTTIEEALKSQAEYGANERSSKIISDVAHRMMKTLSSHYAELGPKDYSSNRRFLNSLAVEGDHAMEALK